MNALKTRLKDFLELKAIQNNQIDIKKATLQGEFLWKLNQYFSMEIYSDFPGLQLIGGSSNGAGYITAGLVVGNYFAERSPKRGVIVRSQPKKHGTGEDIIGHIKGNDRAEKSILIVHDLLNAQTVIDLLSACDRLYKYCYKIEMVVSLIRNEEETSHVKKLIKDNFKSHFRTIFNSTEFNKRVIC
jgi:orotate phosphoribosyltransferase